MRRLIVLLFICLFFSSGVVYADIVNLDVPTYDQEEFGLGCTMDCSPTAAAMVLGYWDSNGWPRMVPRGSSDYNENPNGVRILELDLWTTMEYTCYYGTSPDKVGPGMIATASNMDPGAQFTLHSFLEITNDNKETAFEILKGYIDNGWPIVFSSYAGLKYYFPNLGTYGVLTGGHSMTMTGYRDDPAGRIIFLNSGWGYPRDKMWVDYDDLGVDLDRTDPKQIWIVCVVPGGTPSSNPEISNHWVYVDNFGPNEEGFPTGPRLQIGAYITDPLGVPDNIDSVTAYGLSPGVVITLETCPPTLGRPVIGRLLP